MKIGRLKNDLKWNYGVRVGRAYEFSVPLILVEVFLFKLREKCPEGAAPSAVKKIGFWKFYYFKWPKS